MNPIILPVANAAKHAVLRTISVICVLLVIAGLWFAVDKAFIHPRKQESYQQKADSITNQEWNYDYSDKDIAFFGLRLWKLRLGLTVK
jgi:hypothetical protein